MNLPSDPPALSNAVNSSLNDPSAPPGSPPVQVTPASQNAAPDWTTQTEWRYPPPDSRLIQPVTHYDSGNTALNFVMNKVVLPWRNVFAFYATRSLSSRLKNFAAMQASLYRDIDIEPKRDRMQVRGVDL